MTRRQLPPQIKKTTVKNRKTGKDETRYEVVVETGADPRTGRRSQSKRRFATEKEARQHLADTQAKVAQGAYVHKNELTFDQACEDFLNGLHGLKPTTLDGYRFDLAVPRQLLGRLSVQQLAKQHFDNIVRQVQSGTLTRAHRNRNTREGNRKKWGARSVNGMLNTCQRVLEGLVEQGVLARNPAQLVGRVPNEAKGAAERAHTVEEMRAVLAAAKDGRDRHIWHLAYHGLRRGEISGLTWGDVDFEAQEVAVRSSRVCVGGKVIEQDSLKSRSSKRTLKGTPVLMAELRAAKARQAAERLAHGEDYNDGGWVACDERGNPYRPDTLTRKFAKLQKRAGTKNVIRLHDARHTCATIMHYQGVPAASVCAWLGHANPAITMRIYTHPSAGAIEQVAESYGRVVTFCDNEPPAPQGPAGGGRKAG
ncbi:integrase family protein [Segniliparus rotundus DSM 44985]|uniref:Integrase family protein n=1 Tax=Segniliparus rotundus (strain ATCC BAA-972 / CDC 1076 / CIP 108378 / DSM 44985 / JCM 13578) TaxID=640132 RepID=D6ZDV8_SEGRD|nr:tyrosine-type recombinase/integrase [Segniliparus rotundus]ADG99365.1 integrase family protein [Segniliparus rotundus DSM 44985]